MCLSSCVTPAGTSTNNLASRINGMSTHTHIHTATEPTRNITYIYTISTNFIEGVVGIKAAEENSCHTRRTERKTLEL